MKAVDVDGKSILFANIGGTVFATSNVCSHEEAYLSEGHLDGKSVACPLHDSQFDLATGEATLPPAEEPIPVYKVAVKGGQIYIET